jgi:CheY-like chemotaxis protein
VGTDPRLAQEAFLDSKKPAVLHVVRDGVEAMAYLRHEGAYAVALRPQLILLDLKLPKMGGREVLTEIKRDAALRTIPTIVLTASDAKADINYCYENGVNCYVIKPGTLDAFTHLVTVVNNFWSTLTKPPSDLPGASREKPIAPNRVATARDSSW